MLLKNQVFWPNIPEEWDLEIHCNLATVNLVTAALHNLTVHLVQVYHYVRYEIITTHNKSIYVDTITALTLKYYLCSD